MPDVRENLGAAHSNPQAVSIGSLKTRYWHSPVLSELVRRRYVNRTNADDAAAFIQQQTGVSHFRQAVSIGCGAAHEELMLLQRGIVDKFILCDESHERLYQASELMLRMDIAPARVSFVKRIDLDAPLREKADLVYWRDALHHMPDVDKAFAWSTRALRGRGVIYCMEYCGPERLQWTGEMMDWCERVRGALPVRYLDDPYKPGNTMPLRLPPESPEFCLETALGEAVGSEKILDAIKKHTPNVTIAFLGGVIYHYVLMDIIQNFDEQRDMRLLEMLMALDEMLAARGLNHYFTSVSRVGGEVRC